MHKLQRGSVQSMRQLLQQKLAKSCKKVCVFKYREGSLSKDLIALQPLLTERTCPYMCLITDDRDPLDINEYGHLDYMIRELISHGTHPLAAYRAASFSEAKAFGLKDCGLIAPVLRADIVALRDLKDMPCRKCLLRW